MARAGRQLRMGLQTLLGLKRQGFFLPYRYADSVRRPGPYPAFEELFKAAEPAFAEVLGEIGARADALKAIDGPAPEPRWRQDWFPRADGAAAYAMIAARAPGKVVEVGSGHSTRFMARAVKDNGLATRISCIDPEPRAALIGLDIELDMSTLAERHMPLFEALGPGDVAFFDSSHLLMPGTDVDMIFNRIFPILAPGVVIHVHDILLPDPYPARWEWRGYAEQNGIGGWLLGGAMRPIFASHYAVTRMGAAEAPGLKDIPLPEGAIESSLWLERT